MPATGYPDAKLRGGASRRARQLAVALGALICAIVLGGCGPLPALQVVRSGVAAAGGSCSLTVDATGLASSTTYGLGMRTSGPPVALGELTSSASGVITNGRVTYPGDTLRRVYPNVSVGLYHLRSGQLGTGLAATRVTIPVCLRSGLRP